MRVTDVIHMLNNFPSPCNEDAADVNDDGTYNLTDAIVLNNFLFVGGNPPPPGSRRSRALTFHQGAQLRTSRTQSGYGTTPYNTLKRVNCYGHKRAQRSK